MSTEPSESRIRDLYANATAWDFSARDERPDLVRLRSNAYAEFDRWLADHDAEIRADFVLTRARIRRIEADVLRDAAVKLQDGIGSCNTGCHVSDMVTLRTLADRIEEEA